MKLEEKIRKIANNPVLWIETFLKIVNKESVLVPFKLNPQQKYVLTHLNKYNICLKSRQLGITSVLQAYCLYLTHTQPNSVCLFMAHSIEGSANIFSKLKSLYDNMPDFIKQPTMANNRKELTFTNGSRIIVLTCGQKESIRGTTLRYAHISEAAEANQEYLEKQLLAIEQALQFNAQIFVESTAKGLNFFSEMYRKAELKESMYKPFFFGWVQDKIMFKQEQDEFVKVYIDNNGRLPTVNELTDVEKSLYDKGASIEQLVWRRLKISNSSEEYFRQEFPENSVEAFVSSGDNIFNSKKIHEHLLHVDNNKTLSIPIDLPPILKSYFGNLSLWEIPDKGKRYSIGADASEGLGQDFSVLEVLDEECNQVAEFKSNKIKAFELAEVLNALGRYYNNAHLVIEKASSGHVVLDRLYRDYGYLNMYKHKDYDARGIVKKKLGFLTNSKTRPIMINDFLELFETNQINIRSKYLLSEMKLFIVKDGKKQATNGKHDDAVISMGLAIQGVKSRVKYSM